MDKKQIIQCVALHSFMLALINIACLVTGFQLYDRLQHNQIAVQIPLSAFLCIVAFTIWNQTTRYLWNFNNTAKRLPRLWGYIYLVSFVWGILLFLPIHYRTNLISPIIPIQRISIINKAFMLLVFQAAVNGLLIVFILAYKHLSCSFKEVGLGFFHDLYIFSRHFPRITALFIGCMLTIFLICCFEVMFWGLYHYKKKAEPSLKKSGSFTQGYFEADTLLGYRPQASTQVTSQLKAGDAVVYDVTYSIDAHHRRKTPLHSHHGRNKFALFFGCSFTFGEGVQDNETLPFYFSQSASDFTVYNYGFHGYGPQEMLAKLQEGNFLEEIQESSGIIIYTYLPEVHELRAIGSMYVYNGWGANMPYYKITSDNELVRQGNFSTGRRFTSFVYKILGRSFLVKYFNLQIPAQVKEEHYALTARILEESRNILNALGKANKFYVVIYPTKNTELKLLPYLRKAKIKYFDYSNLFDPALSQYYIIGDGHPSPQAYRVLAEQIAEDVNKDER